MPTFTIQLDEVRSAKAIELAVYFKMSVEEILNEGVGHWLYSKEQRMINEKADPLGQGDSSRGYKWRQHLRIEEMKRQGLWQAGQVGDAVETPKRKWWRNR